MLHPNRGLFLNLLILGLLVFAPSVAFADEPTPEQTCSQLGGDHKLETSWYSKEKKEFEKCTSGGKPDGPYLKWFENGQKESEGNYREGQFDGIWKRWYQDGKPRDIGGWSDGKPHGLWKAWHPSGKLKSEGEFVFGVPQGSWTYYYENGNKREEGSFEAGVRVCPWKTWAPDGTPRSEAESNKQTGCKGKGGEAESTPQESVPQETASRGAKPPAQTAKGQRPYTILVAAGASYVTYDQTPVTSFNQIGISTKLDFTYTFLENWSAAANAFMTALPLTTNPPGLESRFFGANLRVGYSLPFIQKPWIFSIAAGIYYSTMFTSGNYGYKDLLYPEIYPALTRLFSDTESASIYFKYVPLNAGIAPSLVEKEIAIGIHWRHRLRSFGFIEPALDFSTMNYNTDLGSVNSSSVTLSLGYGF